MALRSATSAKNWRLGSIALLLVASARRFSPSSTGLVSGTTPGTLVSATMWATVANTSPWIQPQIRLERHKHSASKRAGAFLREKTPKRERSGSAGAGEAIESG